MEIRPTSYSNSLEEQDICENIYSESIIDPVEGLETEERGGLDQETDSDDSGVSIYI